jgi:hypothetical protein
MKVLIAKGANLGQTTNVIDYQQRSAADNSERQARDREIAAATGKMPIGNAAGGVNGGGGGNAGVAPAAGQGRAGAAGAGAAGARGGGAGAGGGRAGQPCDPNDPDIPCRGAGAGAARGPSDIQQIGRQGGFTALHYAVRDGFQDAADALLDAGADVNRRSEGDLSTPLVVSAINGQYDIAIDLLKHGADPNLPSDDGVSPLFAVLNNEWALRTWYPQPTAGAQQKASYLDVIEALLKAGADPNERTLSHIWYASYNTGRMGVDFAGATAFWRAAYSLDVDAMRLLVKYGADPSIPTMSFGAPKRPNDPSPPVVLTCRRSTRRAASATAPRASRNSIATCRMAGCPRPSTSSRS